MNKNLLAIAITAALALPTMAAAEVKIIGQAQLELVNTTSDAAGVADGITLDDSAEGKKISSGNASALGVTGSHDLGNGMTGLYKINYNFHADDADGETVGTSTGHALSARDRFVGLKGDFGTVLIGRVNSPYKTATVKWDPFLATFMQARGQNGMSGGKGGVGHNSYADEVIAYANKFGSMKFVGAIALDETLDANGDINGDHVVTFSLNMPVADSLELALGYFDSTGAGDGTAIKAGLKWTSGDLTVAGHYENLGKDLNASGTGEQSNIFVTASKKLGAGASVSASFDSQTDESDADGGIDGTYTAIGYKKALSKKVSWHAGIVIVDEGVVGSADDITRIGGGIRVKF